MNFIAGDSVRQLMNRYAAEERTFVFAVSFDMSQGLVLSPQEATQAGILFSFPGFTNFPQSPPCSPAPPLKATPPTIEAFRNGYKKVLSCLQRGDTYLLNLTFSSPVTTPLDLEEIVVRARASVKFFVPGCFACFSPETFVELSAGKIRTFPMKGTIRADLPAAEKLLLESEKEAAEHATLVDLLRNDLAMVARNIRVQKYRAILPIATNSHNLLQTYSEIVGDVEDTSKLGLGDLIFTLLPAGSICGAPKQRTRELIHQIESHQRGFYTGICGYFRNGALFSGIMIRFIEQIGDQLMYKSGGGITALSSLESEYQELQDKIYVPLS